MKIKYVGKAKAEILGLVLEPGQEFEVLNETFLEEIKKVPSLEISEGKPVQKAKKAKAEGPSGCPKVKEE